MEDRLVAEYIGKDADKIMDAKVNWSAAILGQSIGPIWFFYRKAYLIGFAFIILTLIVGKIASALGINQAYYIMFFIYLFSANKVYLWDVRRKVNKMLSDGNVSEDQLVNYVRGKGGTSTLATVLYIVGFIAFLVFYFMVILSAMSALMSI